MAHHILELELVAQLADRFDIIHFHTGFLQLPLARRLPTPSVTTLHGRLDLPDLFPLMAQFRDAPMVSISNAQRQPFAGANYCGTVYHGLPPRLLPYSATPGDYVVFLGRISPEKRADRAIEIARRAGVELVIAAKVDEVDREYFATTIEPLLAGPGVRFIGEVSESQKAALLGGARALLFPIDWPEPFGMVVIEALACGTPVIAWNHGSVPELLEPGVDGCIVESVDEAVDALRHVDRIDRRACRSTFARRFTAKRMARDYLAIYETLMSNPGAACLEALSA
jgi:glycosyltransferase involved in cell wall biosynthesis